ncbi:unnamed protein product [Diatraea saccharalis]|uniref:Uncharacterized protein n=1 Tax=Diatraea saccharalis TaxID=40085 RepID=A0A9N9RHG1_9NEOP|nr:unnamed protein product [Diatraea saccharalis]
MSLRKLALVGATLYNSGVILLVFTNSIEPFFICVGLLQGAGIGFIYNVTYTILNEYFVQKRLFAFCVIQTLTGKPSCISINSIF